MNIITSDTVTLEKGKHFTIPGLLKHLNANYTHRINLKGKYSFNINDVHQYVNKGQLPLYIGNIKIKRFDHIEMGLTFVELTDKEEDYAGY